jgi:hypothetical protein
MKTVDISTDSSIELLQMLLLLLLEMEASELACDIVCERILFAISSKKAARTPDITNS